MSGYGRIKDKGIPMTGLVRRQHATNARFVWFWFVLTVGIGLVGFLLFIRNTATPVPASWGVADGVRTGAELWINAFVLSVVSPVLISFLGALIVTQRPDHPIGRLLIVLGTLSALPTLMQEWAIYGYYTLNVPLSGALVAAWANNWLWVIQFSFLLLTAALFPEGRFLSRGWGWFVGVPLAIFALSMWMGAAVETPMSSSFQMPNPFISVHPAAFYAFVFSLGTLAMPLAALAVLISAVVRFRRSQGQEHQQMKWLMYGVAVMAFLTVAGLGIYFGLGQNFGALMVNVAVIGPALGVGVALLRHRLYDIDILIRRTLQYTLLTALLALVYFGTILVLQTLFDSLTDRQSPVVIVLSTLLIAALFTPLRHRVQDVIDRRFFRKKYDATQVLATFAVTARDETDLDKLTGELGRVVHETMQPESVGIWLKQ